MNANSPLDPSPRRYAPGVRMTKRVRFDPAALPPTRPDDIEDWLLGPALRDDDLVALFNAFSCKLASAGLGVERTSLHAGTLHPQLVGYAWNWSIRDGICDEVHVDVSSLDTDAYRRNPIARVIEDGVSLSYKACETTAVPGTLLQELFDDGFTQYDIFPLSASTTRHNSASLATGQPDGFSAAQTETLRALFKVFALHVQRHISDRISSNIASAYLGAGPGRLVHQGQIRRGEGASIPAIIWVSDMRDFTGLSERLTEPQIIAALNDYFAVLAQTVMDQGGEVLKFMGDGLLAVFRLEDFSNARAAAQAAFDAAQSVLAIERGQNADTTRSLPLRTGIALHKGDVFFGNIGAPERLDFTVIGPQVNAAARIEALCKQLDQSLLISEPVAHMLAEPLVNVGAHALRGVAEPVLLFAPDNNL